MPFNGVNRLQNVQRIDDQTFAFDAISKNKMGGAPLHMEARINVPDKERLAFYGHAIDSLFEEMASNGERKLSDTFTFEGERFKLVEQKDFKRSFARFLEKSNMQLFLQSSDAENIKKFNLVKQENIIAKVIHTVSGAFNALVGVFIGPSKLDIQALKEQSPTEVMPNSIRMSMVDRGGDFNDPFTRIATKSFQQYEKDFRAHDYSDLEEINSNEIVILTHNENNIQALKLIPSSRRGDIDNEEINAATRNFKIQLISEYGKEKVDYIEHEYRMNLDEMMEKNEPLTPEHIYRFNIGVNNIEAQDIRSLHLKLNLALDRIDNRNLPEGQQLRKFFNDWRVDRRTGGYQILGDQLWSNREIRGIMQLLGKENPTIGDLKSFAEGLRSKNQDSIQPLLDLTKQKILSSHARRDMPLTQFLLESERTHGVKLWGDKEQKIIEAVRQINGADSDKEPTVQDFLDSYKAIQALKGEMGKLTAVQRERTSYGDFLEALGFNEGQKLALQAIFGDDSGTMTVSTAFNRLQDPSADLPVDDQNMLINILKPSEEGMERSYTGRKIHQSVGSAYTTADKRFYKPWIDQQETLQIFSEIQRSTFKDPYTGEERKLTEHEKWVKFHEIATFVLCKKHLFKSHPEDGIRVGMLIPAPSDSEGRERWYKVAQFTSNNHGLMSYILEPVGKDSDLPAYVVNRSTASSQYSYQGGASVLNDLNPLNSPGYLGSRFMEQHLDPFMKQYSVPTWVHYQHSAARSLEKLNPSDLKREDLNNVKIDLERANKEILADLEREYGKKSLHEIVKKFDGEIADLSTDAVTWGRWLVSRVPLFGSLTERGRFESAIFRQAHDYSKQSIKGETVDEKIERLEQEQKDARTIIEYLNKYEHDDPAFDELREVINKHILTNEWESDWAAQLAKLNEEGFSAIQQYEHQYNQLVTEGKNTQAQKVLIKWNKALLELAELKGEDVASKKTNGLHDSGHSLGASTSEVRFFKRTAEANRLPPPGSWLNANVFDDPGMNDEDNSQFLDFVYEHKDLMVRNNVKLKVDRSQERGDFVPMGSERHLGATVNEDQQKRLMECKNVEINSRVQEATTYSLSKAVSDVETKHAAMLEGSKREKTSIKEVAERVLEEGTKLTDATYIHYVSEILIGRGESEKGKEISDTLTKAFKDSRLDAEEFLVPDKVFSRFREMNPQDRLESLQGLGDAKRYAALYSLQSRKGATKITREERKELKRLEKVHGKTYSKYMKIAKSLYEQQMLQEASHSFKHALGDKKVVYIDERVLSGISGSDSIDSSIVNKIWGIGLFMIGSNTAEKLRRWAGLAVAPLYVKSVRDQPEHRVENKGHGYTLGHSDAHGAISVNIHSGVTTNKKLPS